MAGPAADCSEHRQAAGTSSAPYDKVSVSDPALPGGCDPSSLLADAVDTTTAVGPFGSGMCLST
jgi:hypothetical protein